MSNLIYKLPKAENISCFAWCPCLGKCGCLVMTSSCIASISLEIVKTGYLSMDFIHLHPTTGVYKVHHTMGDDKVH